MELITKFLGLRIRLIRLPSAEIYAAQVAKEQEWLSRISPHSSIKIPEPLFMGNPSEYFPWKWSIYNWIEGESANVVIDCLDMKSIAMQLSNFLNELHKIDISQVLLRENIIIIVVDMFQFIMIKQDHQ